MLERGHSALAIDDGSKALVCFGFPNGPTYDYNDWFKCDIFECSSPENCSTTPTFSSLHPHYAGGLGSHMGEPVTVGTSSRAESPEDPLVDSREQYKIAEKLTEDGWIRIENHPVGSDGHSFLTLPSGKLLLLGGVVRVEGYDRDLQDEIYELDLHEYWNVVGKLQEFIYGGSSMLVDNSIFLFPGQCPDGSCPIQRLDLVDEAIDSVDIIGNHTFEPEGWGASYFPQLFYTEQLDACVAPSDVEEI
ncbi:Oidioi.mRNA.OKI2018_I69.chr2.g4653.t1.cds [Oikopleura dioica]|uniref:Oidioi.mRNA.OKI2018_I69.chr2.g4653.t1.cds n=1 Tax=Oikopleura dioica TaxID=34765 RepID=A0ABN7SY37_OIKDI|nr:Oidioi.mRNA.OKI2018_I69.chr2.g4653.t1.cds [Oikopleura dioica]